MDIQKNYMNVSIQNAIKYQVYLNMEGTTDSSPRALGVHMTESVGEQCLAVCLISSSPTC